jgi:replication-associated recombination protein RarA
MSSPDISNLIIHPQTRRLLEAYLSAPTHTLLLSGLNGVGLGTIAAALARQIAGAEVITIKPTLHAQQKTANINVADVKSIQRLLLNKRTAPLAVVIDEVDKMTATTPETLLKLLEEPVENLHFILTTHNMFNMPATIVSRSQVVNCLPTEEADQLLAGLKPAAKQRQIEFMARGLPAEIVRLLEDEAYFRANARQFETIKQFVNSGTYGRLVIISQLKNRPEAVKFVENLAKITVLTAPRTGKTENLALLSDITERLQKNGNLKAQLTYLATNY